MFRLTARPDLSFTCSHTANPYHRGTFLCEAPTQHAIMVLWHYTDDNSISSSSSQCSA